MRKSVAFFGEVRAELAKVVWPSRQRAVQLTVVVIIATIVAGAFLAAVDFGLSQGIQYVIDTSGQKKSAGNAQSLPSGTQPVPVKPGQAPAAPGQAVPVQPNSQPQPPTK